MKIWLIGEDVMALAANHAIAGDEVTVVEPSLIELGDFHDLPEPDRVLIRPSYRHLEPFLPDGINIEWLD